MHHARMVRRLFSYIGEGGHIPHEWFAAEVARLDNVNGDIEALADRLAGVRSWAYIAHRADWLADPAKWAERTREVEARLSRRAARAADPALRRSPHRRAGPRHRRARRRRLAGHRRRRRRGQRRARADRPSGGLRFPGRSVPRGSPTSACCSPPPSAAWATSSTAAPRSLIEAPDTDFRAGRSRTTAGSRSAGTAMSSRGSRPAARCSSPRSGPAARSTACRRRAARQLRARLEAWLDAQIDRNLRALKKLAAAAADRSSSPGVRALAAMLADAGGVLPRRALVARDRRARTRPTARRLHRLGVRLGAARRVPSRLAQARRPAMARRACSAVRAGQPMPALPPPGAATLDGRRRPARRGARLPPPRPAAGFASTSPTGSRATRTRSARHGGDEPVDLRAGHLASASTKQAIATADGGGRLRPRGRGLDAGAAAGRPRQDRGGSRVRQRLCRAGRSSSASACGSTAYLHCIRLVKSRTLAQALIETGHVRIDGKRVDKAERAGARRQRHRAAACRARCGSCGCLRCPRAAARPARRAPAMKSWRPEARTIDEPHARSTSDCTANEGARPP